MREDQIARIDAAILQGYDVLAGDTVTIVGDADYPVTCIMYDLDFDGLRVTPAGTVNDGIREIIFTQRDIASGPGYLSPEMYFTIDGERWDYAKLYPISEAVVPIAGIQNLIVVRVSKAAELERTDAEAAFGWSNP